MSLLDMARRINKSGERRTAILVHWRGASICKIIEKSQGYENNGQGKRKGKGIEGAGKELYQKWGGSLSITRFFLVEK